ncbi:hypothetical protein TSUD_406870 [Trifolium subterraneum]|uniref:Uncharacterized protein n=1 Tax=Trifolium subterraneum TaxID=3900 RepID=A0A2Z6NXX7_TRISU|nr:hypothetical protein TSUD_406870 [Trifolium subterraneum]
MGTTANFLATQLIDGDGGFNITGLDNFIKTSNTASCGLSYAVVAIMGPQSSDATVNFIKFVFVMILLISGTLCTAYL